MMMTQNTEAEIAASHGHESYCFECAVETLVEEIREDGFTDPGEYDDLHRGRELHSIVGERLATGDLECQCTSPEAGE